MRSKNIQLTYEGFNKRFEEHIKKTTTYKEAYERVEGEHESNFGHRKYNSYDSFRITRHKKINK